MEALYCITNEWGLLTLFVLVCPILFVRLAAPGDAQSIFRHILGNGGTGTDIGTVAYLNGSDQNSMTADKGIITDGGFVFVDTVEIGSGGAATHVAIVADLCISQIGKVGGPGILADLRILGFYETADVGTFSKLGALSYVGIGTDESILTNNRIENLGGVDSGPFFDLGILNDGPRTDHSVGSNQCVSPKNCTRQELSALFQTNRRLYIATGGVEDHDATGGKTESLILPQQGKEIRENGRRFFWYVYG